jgi:hypothetical protein
MMETSRDSLPHLFNILVTSGKVWRPAAQVTRPQVGRHVGGNRILTNRKTPYKLSFCGKHRKAICRSIEQTDRQNMCFHFGVLDPGWIRYSLIGC